MAFGIWAFVEGLDIVHWIFKLHQEILNIYYCPVSQHMDNILAHFGRSN